MVIKELRAANGTMLHESMVLRSCCFIHGQISNHSDSYPNLMPLKDIVHNFKARDTVDTYVNGLPCTLDTIN